MLHILDDLRTTSYLKKSPFISQLMQYLETASFSTLLLSVMIEKAVTFSENRLHTLYLRVKVCKSNLKLMKTCFY